MEKKTGEFTVQGDDGRKFVIYEYTDFVRAGSKVLEGQKTLRTAEGLFVTQIEDGVYEIIGDMVGAVMLGQKTIVRRI